MLSANIPGYFPSGEFYNKINRWSLNSDINDFGNLIFCRIKGKDILAKDAKEIMDPLSKICTACNKCAD